MIDNKNEIPADILRHMAVFGSNLRIARVRRHESQEQFADRLGVTRQTVLAMEKGSPTVVFGTYAKALWLIGMTDDLSEMASPDRDVQGKVAERERDPERVRAQQTRNRQRYEF